MATNHEIDAPQDSWTQQAGQLSFSTLVIFGLPAFSSVIIFGPEAYLSSVFAKFYGLDLIKLGMALAIIGVVDTFTDPIIGYISDNYPTRWGRRKPWIIAGTALSLFALYFLLASPFTITLTYFVVWLFVLRLGQTFFSIPKQAMAVELTHDYGQRTRLYGFFNFMQNSGRLVFILIPLLPFFATNEMSPAVFNFTFYLGLLLFPIAVWIFVKKIPEQPASKSTHESFGKEWKKAWSLVRRNPPFLYYILSQTFLQLGIGIVSVSMFLYFDVYLELSEHFSLIGTVGLLALMVSAPLWLRIAKSVSDKRRLMVYSGALASVLTLFYVFLEPGENALYYFLACNFAAGVAGGGALLVAPSIFADIVDYGNLKTGQDAAGAYVAINGIITKLEFSLAAGLGFVLMGLGGFDPSAETVTDAAVRNLKIFNIGLPMVFMAISIVLYWRFPITPKHQAIIAKRLAQRVARQAH